MKIKKQSIQKIAILTIILSFSGLTAVSCSLVNKGGDASNKVVGGTEQSNATVNNNTRVENKAPENKSVAETKQESVVNVYDGRDTDGKTAKVAAADEKLVNEEFNRNETAVMEKSGLSCDDDSGKDTSIIGAAEGAFTKPDSKQKAFLYERCRSGRSFGIGGIMIVEDGKVVMHYIYGENGLDSDISALPDVNKNGLSEIVLEGGGTGQGYTSGVIDIFEFKSGVLSFLGRADTYSDNSGAAEEDSKVLTTAYKILVQAAADPVFSRDTYEKRGNAKTWTLTKKAEKLSLDKKEPPKFVKIS